MRSMMGGDINGQINYFSSTIDGCPPCVIPCSIQTDQRSNIQHEWIPITIHDLRGKEQGVTLDANAFEILKYHGSIQEEFDENSEAKQIYYREISDMLKQHLGAAKVIVYNHAFRSRGASKSNEKHDDSHRVPASYPHVDIHASAVPGLVMKLLGEEEGQKALQKRVQVINVWRPIGVNPVTRKPLTICDYQSVDPEKDIHYYTVRGAQLHGAGRLVSRHAEDRHRWYYLSRMRSDEMFVFKMDDTKEGVARFACHTAFTNESEPIPDVEEITVEARCLILYDE